MNGRSRVNITSLVCIAWAIFQLLLPRIIVVDSIVVRAIHLAFAVGIGLLMTTTKTRALSKIRVGVIFISVLSVLYIIMDWEGIALRSGRPIFRDVCIGLAGVICLLEVTRRKIGLALPIVVGFFTVYVFLGPYMVDIFAFKGASITKYVTQVYLSTEGIYGIPLGVSASIVYLFVLLGAMMERAGAGQFFINIALSVLGKYRGGPAKAAVVSSGLMGMMSGSSIANVVTTGMFTIPLMKKVGYPAKKAAAIEVAASTDGQLMPPIMGAAAFIVAEYVNVPYLAVVKAAIIPALASNMALLYITHLEALKLGLKGLSGPDIPNLVKTLKSGWHFLIPIAVLIIELFVLRHSPALAAFWTIVVLMGLIVVQEFFKGNGLHSAGVLIGEGFVSGSKNMVPVALACASAGIIVGLVNLGIGGMMTQIVEVIANGNIFVLLGITALASLILGMGLPTTATYIVMASLTAPIIVSVSGSYGFVVPLIAAHLFCFYFGILADDTPPVGLASYAAAAIAKTKPVETCLQAFSYDVRTAIIPFMFMFNTDIILYGITSWPLFFLILVMTVLGTCTFTSVVQGWCVTKNTWIDSIALLIATMILFNPKWLASGLVGVIDLPYMSYYGIGIVLLVYVWMSQKGRCNHVTDD